MFKKISLLSGVLVLSGFTVYSVFSNVKKVNAATPCIITISGVQYDVSPLQAPGAHPGGNVFVCGTDMTALFMSMPTHAADIARMAPYVYVAPTEAPTTTPVPSVQPTVTPVPSVEPTTTPVPSVSPTLTPAPSVSPSPKHEDDETENEIENESTEVEHVDRVETHKEDKKESERHDKKISVTERQHRD